MANNSLYPATSPYYNTDVVNGKFLDITGAGGIVGEMALISALPRGATAITKTESSKCVISQHNMFQFYS